jgi:phosphotransferase system  glucose/maltose/N-acetylglucosamine-specific IIC component
MSNSHTLILGLLLCVLIGSVIARASGSSLLAGIVGVVLMAGVTMVVIYNIFNERDEPHM